MPKKKKREAVFPLVEAFGYCVNSTSDKAESAKRERYCRFAENSCEKFRQYRFGYCSVVYAAKDDAQERQRYAVCDHRLDGPPLTKVISEHFGENTAVELVPEVKLVDLRTSLDYVAVTRGADGRIEEAIAIETQAIDLRGGGVGPAWTAWIEGRPEEWREYFTQEAQKKGRKDTVAYGVNMANITKRLALQVSIKGAYLQGIGVPLYVVMQDRPFAYLHRRIPFATVPEDAHADITFVTFEYGNGTSSEGELEFGYRRTLRTTLALFSQAMSKPSEDQEAERTKFLASVEKKASGSLFDSDSPPLDPDL